MWSCVDEELDELKCMCRSQKLGGVTEIVILGENSLG